MSRKKLKEDISSIQETYSAPDSLIKNLKWEDENISFHFVPLIGEPLEFNIYPGDDYPENIMVYPPGAEARAVSKRLPELFQDLIKEYCKKFNMEPTSIKVVPFNNNNLKQSRGLKVSRNDLAQSTGSVEDEEDYLEESEEHFVINDELVKDMQKVKLKYGKDSLNTREFKLIDSIDVELCLDIKKVINTSVCEAWGVEPALPVVLRLTTSASTYRNNTAPQKVEVFQPAMPKCGISSQLSQLIGQFVRDNWNSKDIVNTNPFVEPSVQSSKGSVSSSSNNNNNSEGFLQSMLNKISLTGGKSTPTNSSRDEDIAKLLDMGFDTNSAKQAVELTSNFDEAMNYLLTGQLEAPTSGNVTTNSDPKPTYNKAQSKPRVRPPKGRSNSQTQTEAVKEDDIDITSVPAPEDPKNSVKSGKDGMLVAIMDYAFKRIPTLSDYCVICDKGHMFASGLLKPSVCGRELCCWSFQQLGVMADAADDIATGAEVVDLMVSMAVAASKSGRRDLIFDPYPTVFDPANPKKLIFSPKEKDFGLLESTLASFPSIQQLTEAQSATHMKQYMEKRNPFSYALLQWIISSNRSHIVKLPANKHIKTMDTPYQYCLLSAPPEKEAKFRELRAKFGATFAFHGSPVENWHSILRNGLKNASGTKFQINGAAYGNGIYISPHSATSFGYSHINNYSNTSGSKNDNRFLNGVSSFHCVALCEVIDKDIRRSGSIWVCPEEAYVVTRFFFVYLTTSSTASSADTGNQQFVQEIKKALELQYE